MRGGLLIYGWAGLLLLGCSDNQPKANRGGEKRHSGVVSPHGMAEGGQQRSAESFDNGEGIVRFGVLTLVPADGWTRKPPQSSFTSAEFSLPRAKGDDIDGRLTVSVAGGTIEANIDRWKSQFSGRLDENKPLQINCNDLQVTLVDFSGEYNDQRGPLAPTVKRPGHRMIAAIIPIEEQLHFVKAVGPEKTMEFHAEKIKNFVLSVNRNK